jgi:hypothetical protein
MGKTNMIFIYVAKLIQENVDYAIVVPNFLLYN